MSNTTRNSDGLFAAGDYYNITSQTHATYNPGCCYNNDHYPFTPHDSRSRGGVPGNLLVCSPEPGAYQWGFSLEVLLLVIVTHMVWSIGMFALWIDALRNSHLVRQGRKMGRWRAVLDLAESICGELVANTSKFSEKELEESIKEQRPVGYHIHQGQAGQDTATHVELRPNATSDVFPDEEKTVE